jgi:hypothetical protein
MVEATEIEKKSLEAHVELCAERYNKLENCIDTMNTKVSNLDKLVREVHEMMHTITNKRNDQIISWGLGIIGALVATCGWMVAHYVLK